MGKFSINIDTLTSVSAYRKPYLFIIHISSVEVMKLSVSSFTRSQDDSGSTVNYPDQTYIKFDNPRFLGK
jgi:hypothetical protein